MLVATSSAIPHNTRAALWSRTTFCPAVTSFAARGRTNTFCHTRLQTRIAGASHQTDHRAARISRCSESDLFFWVKLCTRYSMVHILPTSSSKSVLNASFFFNISKCKLSSRYCPVHFLSTTFPHRGPHPQKQRPYFGDPRNQFTRKKHRVSRTRVFSPLNSRVPELLLFSICCFHTRTALGSCLMMTWGHDDKTAPGHSSVTSKFP